MNTKIIMSASTIFLALIGISLTFLPGEISDLIDTNPSKTFQLILQILGALYFGFAMLNWMAKNNVIGGIYNKPIAIANFTHFFIGALALIKGVLNYSDIPDIVWILAGLYSVFTILFGLIVFRHPASNKKAQ